MRNSLLKNGKELFYGKGYQKTKVNEISKRSGVSAGSFYNHFSSKEDLLGVVLEEHLELYLKEVEELKVTKFDFEWKIRQLCEVTLRLFKSEPDFFKLVYELEERSEKVSLKTNKLINLIWTSAREVFIEALAEGGREVERRIILLEELFDKTFRTYFEFLIKDKNGNINTEAAQFINLKKEVEDLSKLILNACKALGRIENFERFDRETGAYSNQGIHHEVKQVLTDKKGVLAVFFILKLPQSKESDFFKSSILKEFVYSMKTNFRNGDLLGRLCVNKFILFLIYTEEMDLKVIEKKIERVNNLIVERYSLKKDKVIHYSISKELSRVNFESEIHKLPKKIL